jgi:hypothetical protein
MMDVMGMVHRRRRNLHHMHLNHYPLHRQGRRRLACCLRNRHIGIGKAAKGEGDNEGKSSGGLEAAVTNEKGLGHGGSPV